MSEQRKPFAKLFEIDGSQVLVRLDTDDDGKMCLTESTRWSGGFASEETQFRATDGGDQKAGVEKRFAAYSVFDAEKFLSKIRSLDRDFDDASDACTATTGS